MANKGNRSAPGGGGGGRGRNKSETLITKENNGQRFRYQTRERQFGGEGI